MSSFGLENPPLVFESSRSSCATESSQASVPQQFERVLTAIEVIADLVTVAGAVLGGYAIYHSLHLGRRIEYPVSTLVIAAFAVAVLFVILLDRDGAYRPGNSLLRIKETERALRVTMQTFFLIIPVTFFTAHLFSRWIFVFALACIPVLQVLQKQLLFLGVRALHSRGYGIQRVLIYGAGYTGRRVLSTLVRSPKLGLQPAALIDDSAELEGEEVFEYAYRHEHSARVVRGPVTREMLEEYQCGMLIIAIPSLGRERFGQAVKAAEEANIRLAFVSNQALPTQAWTEHADIDGLLLNVVGRPANKWHYRAMKRALDFVVASVLLILGAPAWMLMALLVSMDSPGPALFKQKRVGKNGKLFDLYKFRSMRVDAPKYSFSPKESADPRITRVGRLLRRTSFDELPQLINVLKGEMSLVGPRPEMPFIVEQYNAQQRQRLQVKPGITGLWQISADRAFLIHENIQYDLYYIRNRSFFMDLAILLHTAVFAMRGV